MLKAGDEPIPGYRLERFLGKGQFGQVWQCTTPGKARAALKFLDLSGKQGWKEFRGIQRVKAIRHPHLMPITALWLLDDQWRVIDDAEMDTAEAKATGNVAETLRPSGPPDDSREPRWLVVAQLLGDKTLGDLLKERLQRGQSGVPVDQLLRYMDEAAKGIDFLNSSGHDLGEGRVAVQHCDIKPDNILLVGDSVLICDFGVAQVLAADTSTTATGMVGSPAYMAPECVERKPSLASDQYSLAVTYVELRTGKLPFKSESYFEVIDAHRKGKLELSNLSPAEQAVIRKATSVDPKDRYATVAELARELRRTVEGKVPLRPSRRRQMVTLWSTVGALVAAVAFFLAAVFRSQDHGGGDVEQTQVFTLHVVPPAARVTIDNQPQSLDPQGLAKFERTAAGAIDLVVSKDPEYLEVRRSIVLGELRDRTIEVRLKHRPDYLVRRAADRWQQGDQASAVEDYVAAIAQDAAFSSFPAPLYLLAKGPSRVDRMAASSDGRWIVCGDASGRVLAWDLQSSAGAFQPHTVQQHRDAIESIALGRQWLASADLAGHVMISRLEGGTTAPKTLDLAENLIKLVITADERWLLTGSDDGTGKYVLNRWDVQAADPSSTAVKLGAHGGMIDEILLPVDRPTVVTASWDRTVRQWPLEPKDASAQGQLLGQLTGDVYCLAQVGSNVAFAGDGGDASSPQPDEADSRFRRHRIVLAALDGQGGQEFPEGHEEQIEVLKSSPSGSWLAAGSVDGMIQVWEIVERKPRGPTVLAGGHSAKVNALSFDSSGQWLLSGGDDGVVALWDLQNPGTPAIVGRHDGPVTQLVVLPDSSAVFSCGEDGSVRKWDLPKCQLILRACRRLQVTPKPSAESDTQVET